MRYEMGVSRLGDVPEVARRLAALGIGRINLIHTSATADGPSVAEALKGQLPSLDICLHLSLTRLGEASPAEVRDYLQRAQAASSVLLLSGWPAPAFSSLQALRSLDRATVPCPIHIAYNPYLEGSQEDGRLRDKLQAFPVQGIYLQVGYDLATLETLETKVAALRQDWPALAVYGCLLLPTPALLKRLGSGHLLPGVHLSQTLIDNPEQARRLTQDILRKYREMGVTPLVEQMPATVQGLAANWPAIQELLSPSL